MDMDPNELDEMVAFIKEEVAAGRTKINSKDLVESLEGVKLGADGKVDPSTIGGSLRAFGRALFALRYHDALRDLPLIEVQRRYFEILNATFGTVFDDSKREGANAQIVAKFISSDEEQLKSFTSESELFV